MRSSASGRCCRKSPKLLHGQFSAERRNTRRLLVDMPSGQLPKSPASSSLYDARPQTIVRAAHVRVGKVAFSLSMKEPRSPTRRSRGNRHRYNYDRPKSFMARRVLRADQSRPDSRSPPVRGAGGNIGACSRSGLGSSTGG